MPEPVEVRVGGRTYRVVASTEEAVLQRLASLVDERLRELSGPGRGLAPKSLLLAAISFAHDLEQERERRKQMEARSRETLSAVLKRIDAAIEAADQIEAQPEPEPPSDQPQPPRDS